MYNLDIFAPTDLYLKILTVIKYHYIKSCVAGGCFYSCHCNNDPVGDTASDFYQVAT